MLRDSLFALLGMRLGNRADLIPRMGLEVQFLQESILEQHEWLPWFLETEVTSTLTVPGEERVQLPADFLAEIEDQALWLYPDVGPSVCIPLRKMPYDEMIVRYRGSGRPVAYSISGKYFILAYIPDRAYTLKMRYMAKDVILDSNIQNKWLTYAADVVIAELGVIMAEKHMQHFELAATFRADAKAAWAKLYATHIARTEVNQNRVMEA